MSLKQEDEAKADESKLVYDMIGESVNHFKIVDRIGQGGMGEVYLAEDERLQRLVALKFLAREYLGNQAARMRFIREAQATAKLDHPNIVTIFEVGEYKGRPYFSMRRIEGDSLHQAIEDNRLRTSEKLRIAIQIADGLAAAHKAGVVHRDLKPTNILLDENDSPVILDFGLAKLASASKMTSDGMRVGTLRYMSPEQVVGNPIDHRSDVFSFGVVIYELFSGQTPFIGDYEATIVYSIVHEDAPDLTQCAADIPHGLQRVINKALRKSANDRYQSMSEAASDLKLVELGRSPILALDDTDLSQAKKAPSIAALYLRNLGSTDDEYLSYGITEDLIVDLTRLGGVRVTPMRAILKYKDTTQDAQSVAGELGVEYVLDGSIHKSDSAIRVSAQLIDAASGQNLWAARWEEPHDRLAQIKRALSEGVGEALDIRRSDVREGQRIHREAQNPHAYEFYLRGRFAFEHKKDESDVAVASGLFREAVKEEPSLLAARCGVAETLIHQGQYENANQELSAALTDARSANSPMDEGLILRLLAQSHERQSRWDEALNFADQSLNIFKEQGNLAEEAETLATLIHIKLRRADFDEALKLFERALEIGKALNDQSKVGEALRKMANVYLRKGEFERAMALYDQALEICRKSKDAIQQAHCLNAKGLAHLQTGEREKARRFVDDALGIFKNLADRNGEALSLNIYGTLHHSEGNYDDAISHYEKGLEIYRELGARGDEILNYCSKARSLSVLGKYQEAGTISTQALADAEELQYPLGVVAANQILAYVALAEDDIDLSQSHYFRVLEVVEKVGLNLEKLNALADLAELQYRRGDYEKCRRQAAQALELCRKIREPGPDFKAGAYLGAVEARQDEFDQGLARLREVRFSAQRYGDPRFVLVAERLLGEALFHSPDAELNEEGRKTLDEAKKLAVNKKIVREQKWIDEILAGVKNT